MSTVMKLRNFVLAVAACALTVPALGEHPLSPYAGQQTRAIKALSPEDLAGLLNGEGMGMAKAAELNGYPGPVHVLELAGSPRRNSSKFRRFSIA
jgi:hypothetical protein